MKKYASMTILSASLAPTGKQALRAFAHRHSFTYDPRPGYLYVRSRAISSRCNDNYDEFPAEEIKKAYATFVGKPVFVNHHNDNHKRARGVIIDAALHEDRNPDGSPDTWAEVLMEVDAVKFPKLAKAILAGHVDRTSMGTDVAFSKCSVCNNKATNPTEYCQHIPKMKGQRIYRTTASGKKEGVLVREICHGLGFFENSLLVEEPADPTAYFLGVDDHSKTATRKTADWSEARHAQPIVHVMGQRPARPLQTGDTVMHPQSGYTDKVVGHAPGLLMLNQSGIMHRAPIEGDHSNSIIGETVEDHDEARRKLDEVGNPQERDFLKSNPTGPTKWSSKTARPVSTSGHSAPSKRETGHCATCGKAIYHVENSAMGGWQHDIDGASGVPHQAVPAGKTAAFRADPTNPLHQHLVEDHAIDPHLLNKRDADYLHALHHEQAPDAAFDPDALNDDGSYGRASKPHTHAKKLAYGETMAPADVDTLRDEECPVCGEADAYDGNECQVCGFVTPPKMFLDPDVDMAKKLDLRKDVAESQAPGEDLNGDGMPDSIPGSTQPGSDATGEVDPTMLDENGLPVDPQTGQALDADSDTSVDPATGMPIEQNDEDPDNIDPETGLPVQVNDDVDPNQMAPDGQANGFGSQLPGDANDGVPDLICPNCGFEAPSAVPTSVNTADPASIPAGAAAGDVCPNCQKALLESISDAEGSGMMPDPKQPSPF